MNITGTGVAVALAVAIALGFLFYGAQVFMPFSNAETAATLLTPETATTSNQTESSMNEATMQPLPTELTVTDIVVGTGAEATKGSSISVSYVGALPDGTVFDASANHGGSFTFDLGAGNVIRGWDEGLVGMKVGGKRTLVIPPDMAYGNQAVGNLIPANATLLFEVELISVQ